jgi:molybdenum cofactor cytidylyltransferase
VASPAEIAVAILAQIIQTLRSRAFSDGGEAATWKFGRFPIDGGVGLVLTHSLKITHSSISKGYILLAADVERLKESGIIEITAAQIDIDDIGEDEAALMLAQSIPADQLRFSEATTGRVNVFSTVKGIFTVDKSVVDEF